MQFFQTILFAAAPLVALTNPVAEVPLFLNLVQDGSRRHAHRAAFRVALGVWAILSFAAVGGLQLLGVFGIEVSAFRAAGGLLLVVMGLEMLQGEEPESRSARRSPEDAEDALWVPLTMPLLAGPGAIVATVSLTVRDEYMVSWFPLATIVAVSVAALVVYLVLALATFVRAHIHRRGTRILNRFSGLILVAIGFQMGFTGIEEFFAPQ
jgi:multiple antibiotic resistance protein